ncbi:MAG: molybdate ABC transporter substrate-binding protein [Roseobacter sp.]|nr:molybdate ABC transporter substrate-binding protein [Roseobacter sp.]
MARAIKWGVSALLAVALASAALRAETVTVFAAASLKTALDSLTPEAEAATGHALRMVYASSAALARQIEQGAPADIFISANPDWMDHLEGRGTIKAARRINLLGNSLVLIGGAAEPAPRLEEAQSFAKGRIAMGMTRAVPAGIYGRAALESLGLWPALRGRIVETDNVRAALALVSRGEARYGVVYASDAVADPKVRVLLGFPDDSHDPIIYPAVSRSEQGADVLAFLQSEAAWRVFEAQGFLKVEARP